MAATRRAFVASSLGAAALLVASPTEAIAVSYSPRRMVVDRAGAEADGWVTTWQRGRKVSSMWARQRLCDMEPVHRRIYEEQMHLSLGVLP